MKKLCAIAFATIIAAPAAFADPPAPLAPAPPSRHSTCIRTSDIDSMSYPDDHTILFRMNMGPVRVWRNELPRACPGLHFESGIAWTIWGGTVCEKMQVFYVLRRGTPCFLGSFVPADQPRRDGWVPPPPRH
jgi:hypothetical protein